MENDLCLIGKVVKPHGVRGKIKVDYFGGDLIRFRAYRKIYLKDDLGRWKPYEVLNVAPQPPRLILQLQGVERMQEAESLTGKEIYVRKEEMPELEKGEYYWFEILGVSVETEKGKRLGRVKEIFPTGANDVYVIGGKRREIFLPATEEVIQSIDRERGVMKVIWMEGLWEEEDEI